MSVKIMSQNQQPIFDKLPISPAALETAHHLLNSGWVLTYGFNDVGLTGPEGGPTFTVTLPALVATVLDTPNKLSSAQKIVCGKALVKLIVMASNEESPHSEGVVTSTVAGHTQPPSLTPGKGYVPADPYAYAIDGEALMNPEAPKEENLEGPSLKLCDAQKLLCAVKGSGEGSKYWVIAGVFSNPKGLRMAARLSDKNVLSVRVEGTPQGEQAKALAECGLIWGSEGTHASAHYKLGTIAPARVLGAILYDPRLGSMLRLESISDFLSLQGL